MLNKMNLRIKITILTVAALTVTALGMTIFANVNARGNLLTPLRNLDLVGVERQVYLMPNQEFGFLNIITEDDFGYRVHLHPVRQELFQAQSDFQIFSFAIAVGFILLGTLTAYVISGQALKPIKELAQKVEEVDVNNLSKQLEQPDANDEVSRLTKSFNLMLMKLNNSFEVQKLFAQNAAHELKTPLASMRANIEVLKLDDEPTLAEYQEVLDTVAADTEQLIDLVEGLLSFNNEAKTNKAEIVDIRLLFDGMLEKIRTEIDIKQLQVIITGQGEWQGDKRLLEQAFFNLIQNAVRYNIVGGELKITVSDQRIIIDDTGIGIPFQDLKQIFNPFYCADASRSKELGGHGLGLAITKNIFDKHGMDIQIFSQVGKGTKVLINC